MNTLYATTDDTAAVVERYDYGDYGNVRFFDGSGTPLAVPSGAAYADTLVEARSLYTGRRPIPHGSEATGMVLVDYRHRVMNPYSGQFVQRDPLGYYESPNLFTIALASPYVYLDPTGLGAICRRPLRDLVPDPIEIMPPGEIPIDPQLPHTIPIPGIYIPRIPTPMLPFNLPWNIEPEHEHIFYDDGLEPSNEGFFGPSSDPNDPPGGIRPDKDNITRDMYSNCEDFPNDQALRAASAACRAEEPFCNGEDSYRFIPGFGKGNCQSFAECVREKYRKLTTSSRRCVRSIVVYQVSICLEWEVTPPTFDPGCNEKE